METLAPTIEIVVSTAALPFTDVPGEARWGCSYRLDGQRNAWLTEYQAQYAAAMLVQASRLFMERGTYAPQLLEKATSDEPRTRLLEEVRQLQQETRLGRRALAAAQAALAEKLEKLVISHGDRGIQKVASLLGLRESEVKALCKQAITIESRKLAGGEGRYWEAVG